MKIFKLTSVKVVIIFLCMFSCGEQKLGEHQEEKITHSDTVNRQITPDKKSIIIADSSKVGKKEELAETEVSTEQNLSEQKNDTVIVKVQSKPADNGFAMVLPKFKDRIQFHEIPSESAVGIKSYPNAYVIGLNAKTEYAGKMYVTMELASADTPDKVLEYYRKWKENWLYVEGAGIYTFKKEDKYFRETNTLQILPYKKEFYIEIDTLLPFRAQSLIRIYYEDEN